ncbi:MAG: UvrABC system protein A [Actinobacteria bacterium]|nr:UvrABC system protein A [Actinomycetota bacterium]
MSQDYIVIRGAREHNLKNINLDIPRNKLVVMTGLSGSGKSSLAFDTIYAEGQRRYVESLSAYARQFLGQMEKPDVDYIGGLSPAISIDQKGASKNPRSTVGTMTEIYDYLRLLYARIGKPHCHICGKPIARQSVEQIVDQILTLPYGTRFQILAPVVRGRKGEYKNLLDEVRRQGYTRVRVDGKIYDIEEEMTLDKYVKHNIEVVVDRLVMKEGIKTRLFESVETSLKTGGGIVYIDVVDGDTLSFSEHFACIDCGVSFEELSPRMFSFNSPHGACTLCGGLGYKYEVDPDLVVPDRTRSLREGAIAPWVSSSSEFFPQVLRSLSEKYGFSLNTPFKDLPQEAQKVILYGTGKENIKVSFKNWQGHLREFHFAYEGIIPNLQRRYMETESEYSRAKIEEFMSLRPCTRCQGKRLRPESLAVTIEGLSIYDFTTLSISKAYEFVQELNLTERERLIAGQVIKEIKERLDFLRYVGLDYITLDRMTGSLSGGEAQRIRLATQIGSSLVGVLYILDEPSIGLHQRDNRRLLVSIKRLRDLGNTVIVIEHDEETIREADFIVDIGPGAGAHGGEIVVTGSLSDIIAEPRSITGKYLSRELRIPVPLRRREGNGRALVVRGAREHNLKDLDIRFPLGKFICVTGVSGSGKSTLIDEILFRALSSKIYGSKARPGQHQKIEGIEFIDKVIEIDQSPIGRTPRSNPATYTGTFTYIREVFTKSPEARMRGYRPSRFSFNVKGGRCEACAGEGTIKIEMHFLPDVYVPCEICKGKRYNRETLEVRFKGKNIAEVLNMSVEEALEFFAHIPSIKRKLQLLFDVGLGYIKLGQSAPTLSGGEAQRVKLSTELSKKSTGRTLYILDEPTTGLHFDDIKKLLNILDRLVDAGNTVVVIEHNLDVIKMADHIIDLGPEGGDKGGYLIAEGTPEEVSQDADSCTGQFLKRVLARC